MSIPFTRPQGFRGKIGDLIFSPSRLKVIEWCTPRSGRVEAELTWLLECASLGHEGQLFWFIAPDYTAATEAMTYLKSTLSPGSFEPLLRTASLRLINGTTISFRSAENPTTLISNGVYALVFDNAAKTRDAAWDVVQGTITNTEAKARIVSTVGGTNNWFNRLCRSVEAPNSSLIWSHGRFTALDAIDADLMTQSDLDAARSTIPSHIFRAMYLCEPYDDRLGDAQRQDNPKLMTDGELALIAGIDLHGSRLYDPELHSPRPLT